MSPTPESISLPNDSKVNAESKFAQNKSSQVKEKRGKGHDSRKDIPWQQASKRNKGTATTPRPIPRPTREVPSEIIFAQVNPTAESTKRHILKDLKSEVDLPRGAPAQQEIEAAPAPVRNTTVPSMPESTPPPNDSKVNTNPFSDIKARDWLANALWKDELPELENRFILMGDGPFESTELAQFLTKYEIECEITGEVIENTPEEYSHFTYLTSRLPQIVVTGFKNLQFHQILSLAHDRYCRDSPTTTPAPPSSHRYWLEQFEDENGEYFFNRSTSLRNITVISQEMLLAHLFSNCPPTADLPSPWPEHIQTHPALKLLARIRALNMDESFVWPSTEAFNGEGSINTEEWAQIGLLKYMGYTVGANGESSTTRREILAEVFNLSTLPNLESPEKMQQWGSPKSGGRLRKMANTLASLTQRSKRNSNDTEEAIADWEDDLAWLKKNYYDGKFSRKFTWPKTSN